jgi:hypothetical protein
VTCVNYGIWLVLKGLTPIGFPQNFEIGKSTVIGKKTHSRKKVLNLKSIKQM